MEPELLLIDKPKGITSFDVIRRLRRHYSDSHDGAKAPKMGHAGTLDPLATGLMLIGLGKGTKRLAELTNFDKEYVAEVRFGMSTTTSDMEGEVLAEKAVDEPLHILKAKLEPLVEKMVGRITLPVSAYSAIKVDGVAMYKRARKAEKLGEVVTEVPTRTMHVHSAKLMSSSIEAGYYVAVIHFSVGSGTYIRSLGVELGVQLGYPAMLQSLRRTKVGEFDIKNAQQITDVFR